MPRESGNQAHQQLSLSQQIEQLINQQQLLFTPGSRYEYSNAGVILLGRLIETASAQPFARHINDRIITPLKLNDTGIYQGDNVVARQATPYRITPEVFQARPASDKLFIPTCRSTMRR